MTASICVIAQERFLIGGTNTDKIAIINKTTNELEWEYRRDDGWCKKCNSLEYLKGGDVIFAYQEGASLINSDGEVIFDYKVGEGEELQSVSVTKKGFVFGICGRPTKIVEVNKKGEVTKELSFDTEVMNIHRQFRQIAVTKRGTYLVPVINSNKIVELDANGEVIRDVQLDNGVWYVSLTKKGDWLATSGHAGVIYKINDKTSEVSKIVDAPKLADGSNIEFAAGIKELKNGNYILSNWVGHNGDESQPVLIELNEDGDVVWKMYKPKGFTFIASAYPIY